MVFSVGVLWKNSQASNVLKIVGDKKILVLEWENQLFTFGEGNSDKAHVVLRSLQNFFRQSQFLI